MKKFLIMVMACLTIFGCTIDLEDENDIKISAVPNTATINVKSNGEVSDFYYTFQLESENVSVDLNEIKISYYSDISLITTRIQKGDYLNLSKEYPTKKLNLNIVSPEISQVLETDKVVRAAITFTFESVSGIQKTINSEVSIVKQISEN